MAEGSSRGHRWKPLSLLRLGLALGVLAIISPPPAAGPELLLAARTPRFLYASSSTARPVEVDVDRTAVLRRVVSLREGRATVGLLLRSTERQTGLRFADGSDLSTSREVTSSSPDSTSPTASSR